MPGLAPGIFILRKRFPGALQNNGAAKQERFKI
jgi:hypothetical protein